MNSARYRNVFWLLSVLQWGVQLGDQALWDWIRRYNAEAYYGLPNMDVVQHNSPRSNHATGFGDAYPSITAFQDLLPFVAIIILMVASVFYLIVLWRERKKIDFLFVGLGLVSIVLSYISTGRIIMHS